MLVDNGTYIGKNPINMEKRRINHPIFESCMSPVESGLTAYFDRPNNIWINEDGYPILDLKDFGFTALQRETILAYIEAHPCAHYVGIYNNKGEFVEIFWDDPNKFEFKK